ncbi:tetratricopeptide repeat protein [Thioalkalicoccus limnaeus]|uniref:Tetratricopeptide repeat protein n=1 Tax=Thioalkalicoccus limnaeus TaxID=120681 RepID=A0ABV4BDG4_9GAMM
MAAFLVASLIVALPATAADEEAARPSASGPEARAHAYLERQPPDWAAARLAFEEAAEAGSVTAMAYLGWIYEQGHGVPADGRAAADWYARAARGGAHDFAVKLGWMYLGGDGVARDRATAEGWFRRAIEAGHAPARVAWASVLIADAQGGRAPERVFEARELLDQALAEGLAPAAYFIARLYIEGIGGHPVDAERAAHFTRIGADGGHAELQGWMAFMYLTGRGVEPDPVAAAMWANLAAANGDSLGQQLWVALEDELSAGEVGTARRRALDWAVRHQ